jgi:hypothetical protein
MTLILNNPGCGSIGANTGTPGCKFNPGKIIGAMLVPDNLVFTNANLEGFKAFIQNLILSGSGTRVYPIFKFDALVDNTEDVSVKTSGYGGKRVAKEGKYDFTFEMSKGGKCHHDRLRKWNDVANMKVVWFDNLFNVMMASDGVDGGKGMAMEFMYGYPMKVHDGENPPAYRPWSVRKNSTKR